MWPWGRPAPSILALPIDLIFLFERQLAATGPPSGGTEQLFEIVHFRAASAVSNSAGTFGMPMGKLEEIRRDCPLQSGARA